MKNLLIPFFSLFLAKSIVTVPSSLACVSAFTTARAVGKGTPSMRRSCRTEGATILHPPFCFSVPKSKSSSRSCDASILLSLSNNDDNNGEEKGMKQKKEPAEWQKFIGQNVLSPLDYLWSFLSFFISNSLALGLVLNIFGYGYTFSKSEDGSFLKLRIDTITELRKESQFNKEMIRLQREQINKDKDLANF